MSTPTLTELAVVAGKESPATLRLDASEAVTVQLRFANGGAAAPMTGLSGPGVAGNTVSLPSAPVTLTWDFAGDLGDASFREDVTLTAVRGSGSVIDGGTLVTDLGNDAPVVVSIEPLPTDPTDPDESFGIVEVPIAVADTSGDLVSLAVEWRRTTDPVDTWLPATQSGTLPAVTTPDDGSPTSASFFWNTIVDLAGAESGVVLRATATDPAATGTPRESQDPFRIDNNAAPIATIDGSFFFVTKKRGTIPIPFTVFDEEGDEVRMVFQWRATDQTFTDPNDPSTTLDFPKLPSDVADLTDLLDNPARRAERLLLQICEEEPPVFEGRVGALATPLPPDQVRLPELSSSQAGLLATRNGIAGRTLEILRTTGVPQLLDWDTNPLNGPVDTELMGDGSTALVLDSGPSGWRVREIQMETGQVVRQLASGIGSPRALAVDPQRERLFVASTSVVARFDLFTGAALGSITHSIASGPRDLAALGTNIAVATGDDRLVRFDLEAGTEATLVDGLSEPWGLVRDARNEGSVLVAERGADRVVSIDLDAGAPQPLPAVVAPGAVAELGATPLPSPRALALEGNGARLLVLCDEGASTSLRTLDLGSPVDFDGASDELADPFVREVTDQLPGADAGLSTGIDRTRIVAAPLTDALFVGGGVAQRRSIVPEREGSEPEPFDPATQVVRLDAAFEPAPASATSWRIKAPSRITEGTAESLSVFRWNSDRVPDAVAVSVRALPIDTDLGVLSGEATTTYRSQFDAAPDALLVSSSISSVAAADLDGDGDLDLFIENLLSDDLTLLFQTASGTFTPAPSPLPVGDGLASVAAADLDGDGDLDLVSANNVSSDLTLLFQTAPGTFTPASSPLPVGDSPNYVAAADLDGDGDLDLVSANGGSDDLTLLFQTAPGTFTPASSPLPVGDGPLSVVAADLDGDGNLDLISANSGSDDLTLLLQTAPGTFTSAPSPLPVGDTPSSVAAADLDGDGDLDLVAANFGNDDLTIFFQTAPGAFTAAPSSLPVGEGPSAIVAADLDGDGDIDLVAANFESDNLTLLLQEAPGTFTPAPSTLPVGIEPRSVAAADLDGDGDLDLVSANLFGDELTVLLNGD